MSTREHKVDAYGYYTGYQSEPIGREISDSQDECCKMQRRRQTEEATDAVIRYPVHHGRVQLATKCIHKQSTPKTGQLRPALYWVPYPQLNCSAQAAEAG